MTDVLQPSPQTDAAPGPPAERDTAPLRMTFEEFMAWDPGTGRAEWVDGEVVLVSPATRRSSASGDASRRASRAFHPCARSWLAPDCAVPDEISEPTQWPRA